MYARFIDNLEVLVPLTTVAISPHVITLKGDDLEFNSSGFILYEDDGVTVHKNCRRFIYKYNKYTNYDNGFMVTDIPDASETDPGKEVEIVDPLSNDELTEVVADLMFQVDCLTLGL